MKNYSVTIELFSGYGDKKTTGLQSATIYVEAENKFEAMARAWKLVQDLAPVGTDEPRNISATNRND